MLRYFKKSSRLLQTKISFGATSGIVTILGLIVGLDRVTHPQSIIISGILAIAVADNISDSLGIHIYQESEGLNDKEVWFSTITNFMTRLIVSLTFILLIVLLPIKFAVPVSIAWGLFLLSMMSYSIAQARKLNPLRAILEHLAIAVVVIFVSNSLSGWISGKFS